MARQFIYHMAGLNKAYGPKKILENIHLSFYPDAKIGILGPERRRQVDGAQDHGRARQGVHRRGVAGRRRDLWLPAAGAGARSGPQRHGQRHAGGGRQEGDPRPLQRAHDELFRRDGGRGRQAAGHHRRAEPVGPRQSGRDGHGGARLPAGRGRRRPRFPAARSAASRCASCSCASPTFCFSTNRPTISTPRRRPGSKSTCANIRAPC